MSSAKQYEIERMANVRRSIAEQLGRQDDAYAADDAWIAAVCGEWAAYLQDDRPGDAGREESLLVIVIQALYAKHRGEKGDLLLTQELFEKVPGLFNPEDKTQTDKLRQRIYRLRGKYGVDTDWLAEANRTGPEQSAEQAPSLALPAGQVRPAGNQDPRESNLFYIVRSADETIERLAATPGNTLIIYGPKGFGKTTLLARYRALCEGHGKQVALIDLRTFSPAQLQNCEMFLTTVAGRLGLHGAEAQPIPLGGDLTKLVHEMILKPRKSPLVFLFDHVERLADHAYRSDVFAMLRDWHNRRGDLFVEDWQQTDLVLLTAVRPAALAEDPNFSPFAVGETIQLTSFSLDECKRLRDARNAKDYLDDSDVEAMHELVGGIPALVEVAFRRMISERESERATWKELEEVAAEVPGPFQDYLLFWERSLAKLGKPEVEQAYRRFVSSNTPSWPREHNDVLDELQALGLIARDRVNRPIPASPLHVRYFGKKA